MRHRFRKIVRLAKYIWKEYRKISIKPCSSMSKAYETAMQIKSE